MCCGIGKCGHCKIDDTYICLEGTCFQLYQRERFNRLREGEIMDVNTKLLKKNAFRVTKHRGVNRFSN